MSGSATAEGATAGGFRGGDPGGRLWGTPMAVQPKRGTLRGMPAMEPADYSQQLTSTAGVPALSQPQCDHSVQANRTGHFQAQTRGADKWSLQKSDRDTEDDLVLQSPYAMRLRQQQEGAAAELRQMRSSSSSGACTADEEADSSEGAGRQPDDNCAMDLAGNSLKSQQHQDKPATEQHRPVEGQLVFGTRAGHLPRSPNNVTARGQLFFSPKRGIRSCEEEELITVMSDSHSEAELEISLLSPSPAKRYLNQGLACKY